MVYYFFFYKSGAGGPLTGYTSYLKTIAEGLKKYDMYYKVLLLSARGSWQYKGLFLYK